MAIAFDAFTALSIGANPSGTHTPVGTPRGILVLASAAAGETLSATYGGVSMGAARASVVSAAGGEIAVGDKLVAFLLGSGVLTGPRTVAISGTAASAARVFSVTAAKDVGFVNSVSLDSASLANPSATLPLLGRSSFVAELFASGQDAVAGTNQLANWTGRNESDIGTAVIGCYSYNIIGTTDVTVGLTQTAEDIMLLAVAIAEIVTSIPVIQHHRRRNF